MYPPGTPLSSTNVVACSHHVRSIGAVGRVKGMHWDRGRLIMALTRLISPFVHVLTTYIYCIYTSISIYIYILARSKVPMGRSCPTSPGYASYATTRGLRRSRGFGVDESLRLRRRTGGVVRCHSYVRKLSCRSGKPTPLCCTNRYHPHTSVHHDPSPLRCR